MTNSLIITTNYGTETDELLTPLQTLKEAGVTTTVASVDGNEIQTVRGDKTAGPLVDSDSTLGAVTAYDYDIVVIPGGTLNADALRTDSDALRIVKDAAAAGIRIAAICHGPWLLVNADLIVGKTLTSYPALAVDITNAGGSWVDEEVCVDTTNGFSLITSRTPADLQAFNHAVLKALA
nr:DJ-1/PfpI/YhbO family deglycase/protease [Corynebacterium sp. UBA5992]